MMMKWIMGMLVVVLDFDGSLRPPRDPGLPGISCKMATGSASISFHLDDQKKLGIDSSRRPNLAAIGVARFPVDIDMTSTHSEYKGMLLGLEYLNTLENLQELWQDNPILFAADKDDCSLVIRGDCKAVIDQLSGKSNSRKVRMLHDQAMDLLSKLEHKFGKVETIHVTRDQNTLCDALCTHLMDAIEQQEITSFALDFDTLARNQGVLEIPELLNKQKTEGHKAQLAVPTPYALFARYFHSPTKCRIKYSSRPVMYQALATLSSNLADHRALIEIGERQAVESLILKDKGMLAAGVRNQIQGWDGLNNEKKVAHLTRKHRVVLSNCNENDQGFIFSTSTHLIPTKSSTEWQDGRSANWTDLFTRFQADVMARQWEEGTQMWITSSNL